MKIEGVQTRKSDDTITMTKNLYPTLLKLGLRSIADPWKRRGAMTSPVGKCIINVRRSCKTVNIICRTPSPATRFSKSKKKKKYHDAVGSDDRVTQNILVVRAKLQQLL